ncbi:MAG: DUF4132 domain-containing protein, partial [Algicola sp.]|nr:DUF4132 domain-containing protein [Algicola sp.]
QTSRDVLWGMTNDLNIIEFISQHLDPEQIRGVFTRLITLADGGKARRTKIWTQFVPLIIQYPGKFLLIDYTRFVDGPITEHYWQSSDVQGPSFALVQWVSLLKSDFDHYIAKLDEAFKQHPERKALLNFENNKYADPFDDISPAVLLRLVEHNADTWVVPIMASVHLQCDDIAGRIKLFGPLLTAALYHEPEILTTLPAAYLGFYLQPGCLKDSDVFTHADEAIRHSVNRSKLARDQLGELFSGKKGLDAELLAPWLDDQRKTVRDHALDCLLNNKTPPVAVLQQIFGSTGYTVEQRFKVGEKLVKMGAKTKIIQPNADTMPDTLDELLASAATQKIRKKPMLDDLWHDDFNQQLKPLDEPAIRWLLSMLDNEKDLCKGTSKGLPILVKKLLVHVDEPAKQLFIQHLLNNWITLDADSKYNWIGQLVGMLGDETVIGPLVEALVRWKKGRDQYRGNRCLDALALHGSVHALSCVFDAMSDLSYAGKIRGNARQVLAVVAKQRKVHVYDLYDELLPDFDLSGNGFKGVTKQQALRLEEMCIVGRRWPLQRWIELFLNNPLRFAMTQGLIWQRLNAQGDICGTFRISEDQALIDFDDEEVTIADDETLRLWHPASAGDEAFNAWSEHLTDYELTPLFKQIELPRLQLLDDEKDQDTLTRHQDIGISTGDARRLLTQWQYQVCEQNEYGCEDRWDRHFSFSDIVLRLYFSQFNSYNEHTVQVYFYDSSARLEASDNDTYNDSEKSERLDQIPIGVMAMMISQVEQIGKTGKKED